MKRTETKAAMRMPRIFAVALLASAAVLVPEVARAFNPYNLRHVEDYYDRRIQNNRGAMNACAADLIGKPQ